MRRPKACEHLWPLEALLRERRIKVLACFRTWSDEAAPRGYYLHFDAVLPPLVRAAELTLPGFVVYREYGVAGQYAGYFCTRCRCEICGHHPQYQENLRQSSGRTGGPFT